MKRYGLALGIALILIANAFVFTGIVYNRSGEPDAEVALTEREITVKWAKKENTGLFLKLNWEMDGAYQFHEFKTRLNWFNETKLKELGLKVLDPVEKPDASKYYAYYNKLPSIKAFIVLEFGGESWQSWLRDHQKDLQSIRDKIGTEKDADKKKNLEVVLKQRERLPLVKSRLFAIDAGIDPARLRETYSDTSRYVITHGRVKASYYGARYYRKNSEKNEPARVQGRIHHLFPLEIFVPNSYRTFFRSLKLPRNYSYHYIPENKSDSEILPQYEVTLKFGKKYEAWISNVKPLEQTL